MNMVFVGPGVDVLPPLSVQGTKEQCTLLGRYSAACGGDKCCWLS